MENKKVKLGAVTGGLLLFIGGIILLWWNEGRTVKTAQAIGDFSDSYVEIDSNKVDSANNGKAIYTHGNLLFDEPGASDTKFNVVVNSAVVSRSVEMYQWEEECTTDDNNSESCTYSKIWSDTLIDSSNFNESGTYKNPTTMPYDSERFYAENIKLDAFNIDYFHESLSTNKNYTDLSEEVANENNLTINGKYYQTAKTNDEEQVGDIRISFTYNDAKEISVLGAQNDNSIAQFISKNQYSVSRVEDGNVAANVMIQNMIDENNFIKWILRVVGTLLIIFGLLSIISPLQRLANYVPILGKLFSAVSSAIVFAIGLCISFVVIAIAWFRYRPVLSICLIIAGIGIVVLIKRLKGKKEINVTSEVQNVQ